uniref:ABC transmembrane type-2 domain-containing protein n=1 Tax=Kuetzingia canaliculata TaxID=228262 RepID=A0A1Z1MQ08_KUECA|nr:hypothetical protein [Kuetzingia canaliculata]ARW67942.1 hypothetical protein [Kuetzingia canaliculata]
MNKQKQKIYLKPNNKIRFNIDKLNIYKEICTLTKRLYIQTYRRPSIITINIMQPLLWLILFGALFQKAPINLFNGCNIKYREFLNPGILVFIGFNSSINAGLPIMFDREFGFLNRIITSPLIDKKSLVYSTILHTWSITSIQIIIIMIFNIYYTNIIPNLTQIFTTIGVNTLIIISVTNISICNAFILPGHIEFIAITTLLINLPTLFSSTALSPIFFMPNWLQIIVYLNPLTYAIELIRHSYLKNTFLLENTLLKINIYSSTLILITISILSLLCIKKILKHKYE